MYNIKYTESKMVVPNETKTEKQELYDKLLVEWTIKIKKMSPQLREKEVKLLAEVAAEANMTQI
jgi:hypothetical protein